jgi:hypothetical protein
LFGPPPSSPPGIPGGPGSGPTFTCKVPPTKPKPTPSTGPFPIYWPGDGTGTSGLPTRGLDGKSIIFIGAKLTRRYPPNARLPGGEQSRVKRTIIDPDPKLKGTYQAHHVMPLALNGFDVYPNVVPWPQARHQSEHARLSDQPQLDGQVWLSPTPITLSRYLFGLFGFIAPHPDGVPYRVAGYK